MSDHLGSVVPSLSQRSSAGGPSCFVSSEPSRGRCRDGYALEMATASPLYYERSGKRLDNKSFDADYLQRLAEGDPSVEAHFAAYFGGLLMLKLRSRFRSLQFVEDIRQETFLRVLQFLRQKGGLEHPERLGAFVNSVCNNVILETFRSHSRYAPFSDGEADPIDCAVDLDGALVNEERKRLVQKVLDQLSKMDREILKMLFFDETDKDEICRLMGVDRDYLRVLVHRARLRFRAALDKVEAALT
jgi:RNA polymerase sigma-70 factor, ECF subfamily